MSARLKLLAFRYRDQRTGKWTKARVAARYAEWEVIGPPEIRNVDPEVR